MIPPDLSGVNIPNTPSIRPSVLMASSLSPDQVYHQIREPSFWLTLVPSLAIGNLSVTDTVCINDSDVSNAVRVLRHEGYFQTDGILPLQLIERMAKAVVTLTENACPPVFLAVYDEFWSVPSMLSPLLRHALGDSFRQLPDFWTWHIDPQTESAGWRPHRDKGFGSLLPDGRPKSLTIWIPLTDATTLNGCIYLVPAHLDPPEKYIGREDKRIPENMQDIRALPINAGGVLGWNQAVLHWGSRSSRRAEAPRISYACEYQRGDVPAYNRPLLDPLVPPTFEQRLALVGKQILQYRHMYGLSDSIAEVAQRLVSLAPNWD